MIKRTLLSARAAGHAFVAVAIAAVAVMPAAAQELSPKLAPYADIQGAEKVSLRLLEAVKVAKANKSALGMALPKAPGAKAAQKSVELELVTWTLTDQVLDQIRSTGVTITGSSSRFRRVMVTTADPDAVTKLAALSGVQMVRAASRKGTHAGKVESLADIAMGSLDGSNKYGLQGQGKRIGIISDSLATTPEMIVQEDELVAPDDQVTEIVSQSSTTKLTADILPGFNYVLVVQTVSGGDFALDFTSTTVLSVPTEELGNPICETRLGLQGAAGTVTAVATDIPVDISSPFLAASCAPSGADAYRAFGFRASAPGTVTFTINSNDGKDYYLSLRESCRSLIGEKCAKTEFTKAPPVLIASAPQKTGDLPDQVYVLRDIPSGSDEGAGMAELVHDVAPRAEIVFHTGFISQVSFAEAILQMAGIEPYERGGSGTTLREYFFKCDTIVDDVYYFAEPVYQTGIIALAAQMSVEEGVPYFSAAGNGGNVAIRSLYRDVSSGDETILPPRGGDLHKWPNGTGYLKITVPPRESFYATLQWNQPFQSVAAATMNIPAGSNPIWSARIDMDMYLTLTPDRAGLDEVYGLIGNGFAVPEGRFSKETQGTDAFPGGDAYEQVSYFNDTTQVKTLYLAIDHFTGAKDKIPQLDAPLEFTVNFIDITDGVQIEGIDRNNPATGGPTIFGHATAKGVMSVGAVNYFDTPNFDTNYIPTAEIDPEDFTAKGGQMTTYFDEYGLPVRRDHFQPQIAAPDGNNTTFFGGADFDLDDNPNFFGTSAAAPNAAAVALLMLQLNPTLNPDQIATAMRETAIDVKGFRAGPGVDDTTGAGLLNALAAFDYVAEKYGIGEGPEAPHDYVFSFPGTEGWEFQAPSGFTAPASNADGQALVLTATNNTNSLGWWRSPEIIVSSVLQPPFITINGTSGAASLYRATYVLSSTGPRAETPAFRFRISTRSFEQTSELMFTSTGNGAATPEPGTPQSYRQFFSMPPSQSRMRLYFDMLGFNAEDSATASLALQNVQIDAFESEDLLSSKREKLYLFANNPSGWTYGSGGSDLAPVNHSNGADGLTLGPAQDGTKVSFGFIGSPTSSAPATLELNRLYCARYRIKSDIPSVNRTALPSFRLRMNDSSNQMAALLSVNSSLLTSQTPSDGGYVDYRLYFETPEALVGNKIRLSLDYLYVPGVGDDPTQKITLQSLSLDSYFGPVTN